MPKKTILFIFIISISIIIIKHFITQNSSSNNFTSNIDTSIENIHIYDSVEKITIDSIDSIISKMTLREKVCQMIISTPEKLEETVELPFSGDNQDKLKLALENFPVGGLVYFANNLESVEQTKDMINSTKQIATDLSLPPLFFSVDEEGGKVARCANKLGTTKFSPMYEYRNDGAKKAYNNAYTIAKDISSLGFNLDFAPVADTWSNKENTVIGTRAYSDDFTQTAELISAAVKGFQDGGVYCTLKHFPGHGDTIQDSHQETAYSNKTSEELASGEYLSFKSGIDADVDMIMMGHITLPSLDTLPSSLSYKIIQEELRGKLDYDGVVITDSLTMGAVSKMYTPDTLAVMAIKAGNDILLMPSDLEVAINGIISAVENGEISEAGIDESVKRILELKEIKLGDVH